MLDLSRGGVPNSVWALDYIVCFRTAENRRFDMDENNERGSSWKRNRARVNQSLGCEWKPVTLAPVPTFWPSTLGSVCVNEDINACGSHGVSVCMAVRCATCRCYAAF